MELEPENNVQAPFQNFDSIDRCLISIDVSVDNVEQNKTGLGDSHDNEAGETEAEGVADHHAAARASTTGTITVDKGKRICDIVGESGRPKSKRTKASRAGKMIDEDVEMD